MARTSRILARLKRRFAHTQTLIRVTLLVVFPLLFAGVTAVSHQVELLPFLLFPPLAGAAHTMFTTPESQLASPRRIVVGLTSGAIIGWFAVQAVPDATATPGLEPLAVAIALFLTGLVTWVFDVEHPSSFSTALLVQLVASDNPAAVGSVFIATVLVAAVFVAWRRAYENRADYIYQTVTADERVLVAMRGELDRETALFGGRLAAARGDTGSVVLLHLVDDEEVAAAEQSALEGDDANGRVATAVDEIRSEAGHIRETYDVPCEVVVVAAEDDPAGTTFDVATDAECDIVVAPCEATSNGYIDALFEGSLDCVAYHDAGTDAPWQDALVPVKGRGYGNGLIDFAQRAVTENGTISVAHCIGEDGNRHAAENMLANLVDAYDGYIDTRVVNEPIQQFLGEQDEKYDLIVLGTSRRVGEEYIRDDLFEQVKQTGADVAFVKTD